MQYLKLILITLVLAAMFGCTQPYSEAPKPTNFKISEQHMVQAAHHWEIIAGNVAREIDSYVEPGDHDFGIYIKLTNPSPFEKAFLEYLKAHLTRKCYHICTQNNCLLKLTIDTQVIDHPTFPVHTGNIPNHDRRYNQLEQKELVLSQDLHYRGRIVGTMTRTLYFKNSEIDNYTKPPEKTPTKTYNVAEGR